jgi:hypothetical protein
MMKSTKLTALRHWIRKIGIAGFVFFLLKGLLWLAIGYGIFR